MVVVIVVIVVVVLLILVVTITMFCIQSIFRLLNFEGMGLMSTSLGKYCPIFLLLSVTAQKVLSISSIKVVYLCHTSKSYFPPLATNLKSVSVHLHTSVCVGVCRLCLVML